MDFGRTVFAHRIDYFKGAVMADIEIEGVKRNSSGFLLKMLILLLFFIGFVTLMSVLSVSPTGNPVKQLVISFVSLMVFLILSSGGMKAAFVDRVLRSRFPIVFLCVTLILSLITAFFGPEINGARRWLFIGGFSIQPSEFLKTAVILFLASYFGRPYTAKSERKRFVFPLMLMIGCFAVILFQKDFSTALILALLIFSMMLFAGLPLMQFVLIALTVLIGCLIAVFTEEYRRDRVYRFFKGEDNFQSTWAIHAVGNGGWLGCGWGAGTIKARGILPEAESDFIFAVLAEEFGFLGVLFLLLLILLIGARALLLADRVKNRPERFFLVLGIVFLFLSQTFVNLAVVVGLLPTTGIPLPLFSQGGSSLLCTMFMMGLLVHIARNAEDDNG